MVENAHDRFWILTIISRDKPTKLLKGNVSGECKASCTLKTSFIDSKKAAL
jgi:hypothetical protein